MSVLMFPIAIGAPRSWRMKPSPNKVASDFENPLGQRRFSVAPGATGQAQWRMSKGLFAVFRLWFETECLFGAKKFWINLPSAGGITYHLVAFDGMPQFRSAGYDMYEVTANLEVRDRAFVPTQPPEPSTVLLCQFKNVSDGRNVVDSSMYGNVPQLYTTGDNREELDAYIRAGIGPFGGPAWQHAFQATSSFSNTLSWFPKRAEFDIFNGDFTVEFWFRHENVFTSWVIPICGQTGSQSAYSQPDCWVIDTRAGEVRATFPTLYNTVNGSSIGTQIVSSGLPVDTWQHVALVRSGNLLLLFANGSLTNAGSQRTITGGTVPQPDIALFGMRDDGWGLPNQWMQTGDRIAEVRIKSTAVYTENFTPPTGPFER